MVIYAHMAAELIKIVNYHNNGVLENNCSMSHLQILLLQLDQRISRSVFVVNFFKPYPGDKQLARYVHRHRDNHMLW